VGQRSDLAQAGQAAYTPLLLAAYDGLVLGVSNRLVWRCPKDELLALYNRHVAAEHLDVGVGTGWFLDHCRFPVAAPRVGLVDMNPNSLRAAALRIQRYQPSTHQANVLEPIQLKAPPFRSIGMNYLLHCLPGTITSKAIVFDHLKPLIHEGCPLFGGTILHRGVKHTVISRRLMAFYNRKGLLCNIEDDYAGLQEALASRFSRFSLETRGAVAIFTAWR